MNGESNCFTTVIDHKEKFENKLSVEPIKLVKNEIEQLITTISDKINTLLKI